MNRSLIGALVGGLVLMFAAYASAENAAPAGGTPALTGDLKTDLAPAQYARLIKPIEAKVAEAEKRLDLHKKEMEKPEEKRNQQLLVGLQEQAVQFYIGAAQAAKMAQGSLTKVEQKTAVAEQYEKPNKQKAIDLLMELAGIAEKKKDIRSAAALYKRILVLDPENATAKDALKRLEEAYKQSLTTGKGTGNKGGGDTDPNKPTVDPNIKDWTKTGRSSTDYTGRGSRGY